MLERRELGRQAAMKRAPSIEIGLSHGREEGNVGSDRIRDARHEAAAFGFGSAELVDHDELDPGLDRIGNAMRDIGETAWIELAALRIPAPVLRYGSSLSGPNINHLEALARWISASLELLKDAANQASSRLQIGHDRENQAIDVESCFVSHRSEYWRGV
jgi:hypothetical protein